LPLFEIPAATTTNRKATFSVKFSDGMDKQTNEQPKPKKPRVRSLAKNDGTSPLFLPLENDNAACYANSGLQVSLISKNKKK
jgi:hypothetical protein